MSDIDAKHPLDFDAPRFSIRKPAVRHDQQGDMPDEARVAQAMAALQRDMSPTVAAYLESCIHCGH